MIKRSLLFVLLAGITANSIAQQPVDVIPKIIPPSPNAAALEKFTNIPVDYSTGVPSISYPMWSWQRGKLQFSIGLVYHAGGHKVDDMASNVGLGWSLTGVGRISRTVRGLPDDTDTRGYMYSPELPALTTYMYNPQSFYYTSPTISVRENFSPNIAITDRNTPYANTVKRISESDLDGEQDVFNYSFSGGSGKFIIDKNKVIVPLEHTKNKIEMTLSGGTSGTITSFTITDDKGIVYKYELAEYQLSETYSSPTSFPPVPVFNGASGWLLTKIVDPSTSDEIVFSYPSGAGTPSGSIQYEVGFSESEVAELTGTGLSASSFTTSYQVVSPSDGTPSSITFPDGSTVEFAFGHSRQDLANASALSSVTIKNYQNTIIKKFNLSYSYFIASSNGPFSTGPVSGNDFTKRLRLDAVTEKSGDDAISKPTTFTYNSTALNRRGSMNQDYWGYNVNPARNNLRYAPTIILNGSVTGMGDYWVGADRKPDEVYAKAAILERMDLPTGGYVKYDYEGNKAFSLTNYYEDLYNVVNGEWLQSAFNTSNVFSTIGMISTDVKFTLKVTEFDPRDGAPPGCFAESQDYITTRFEINSTDGTFSTYVEGNYSEFTGEGKKITISIPVDKFYRIKFVYNTGETCAFIYPFKASVSAYSTSTPQDKLAGGLRIKKITADDGTGKTVIKEYSYQGTDGHSSAVLNDLTTIPNYGYYRTTVDNSSGLTIDLKNFLNRASSPTNTLSFNNAPLVYARVIEKEVDGSETERQYDPLVWSATGGSAIDYPYVPIQDLPNLSGMMTKEIVRDNTNTVKSERTIVYNKVQNSLINLGNHRNLKTGVIASASLDYEVKYFLAEQYFMRTSRAEITSDETKMYENGQVIIMKKENTYYTGTNYLKTVKTTNSKNEDRTEEYVYSVDGSGSVYTAMRNKNMLNYVIRKFNYKTGVVGGDLDNTVSNYQLYQSGNLPMVGTIQSSILGGTLETDITFDSYDEKGNVTQYTAKDGVVTSFIWGYNKQYPVAKIVGKSYTSAVSESGISVSALQTPASDAAMRTELNKLRSLSGVLVTTLTHKPLVGVTSETDPNGKTTYYEYDNLNRLRLIRDKDQNIIKKFCYNYFNQVEDCDD
jgi:YD repeat-containing protein